MNIKNLIVRWIWAGITISLAAVCYAAIFQNADAIAKWMAPAYEGLSEEEVFKRLNMPCVHPPGATTGCAYPEEEVPAPTGDEWRDRQNAKIAELDHQRKAIAMQGPKIRHHEEYFQREVVPRREKLTFWTAILFSFFTVGVALYALASARAWWRTSAAIDVAHMKRKLCHPGWIQAVQGTLASRKLRRLDSDFKALQNLHENGLISDEDFEQRKQALRVSIDIV